jgi:hypothetical protein
MTDGCQTYGAFSLGSLCYRCDRGSSADGCQTYGAFSLGSLRLSCERANRDADEALRRKFLRRKFESLSEQRDPLAFPHPYDYRARWDALDRLKPYPYSPPVTPLFPLPPVEIRPYDRGNNHC